MLTVLLSSLCALQGPTATAHAVVTPPVVDGRLTEPAWLEATPVTGFVQRELHEGAPVTERTEVRILTDGRALYVGAWLYDTDPAGIVPGEQVRDGDISKSDYFGILLDTYHDRQNGFVFTTTPAAIEYDAQVVNEGEGGGIQLPGQTRAMAGSLGGFNLNWDGTWTVATSVDSAGWYAEFRIPFTTLRYGAGEGQTLGAQPRALDPPQERRGVLVLRATAIQPDESLARRNAAGRRRAVAPGVDGDTARAHWCRAQLRGRSRGPAAWGDRRRGQVWRDAQSHPRPHLQHRLRAGRGRRAAHQSHALSLVLPEIGRAH